ncbi:S-4TM family putative pore-forming effector [Brevundimonas aurifodinae]|uniref:S-4TM family putative pore-forming effector n=1 Tax=Brevundimonas aurifodinae TaxID=1508312 RepID=A0ABV1NMD6_9CAUL
MNDIPLRQNQEANLRLLRARQEMFHRAKLVFIAQLLLTVLLPVSGAIWGLVHEDQRATIALLSLVMTVVDAALLDRAQRRFVRNGAKAAEAFDCSVLQLPWNTLAAGKPLDDEAVEEAATSWERRRQNKGLIDWYPNEVGQASLSLGRLICQRTNLWYDGRLRRLNGSLALLLAWALPIALLLACWWLNLPFREIAIVLTPAAPVMVWAIREHFRQKDTAEAQEQTKGEAEAYLSAIKRGELSEPEAQQAARDVQNALYARRAASPMIIPGLYQLARPGLERQMKAGAAEHVRDPKS